MAWDPVTTGRSGAAVSRRQGVFRKESLDPTEDLRKEAERLTWLAAQGIPAPEVLDADRSVLVTREVPGRTAADEWPVRSRPRVVDAMARLTRDLHDLVVDQCPFDRRLAVMVPEAVEVRADLVDLADLAPERSGWSRERLVAELLDQRPAHEDPVVCHGDLSLPNVLLDPESFAVTGVIDVGRLGIADRWVDLAIAMRSLRSPQNPQFGEWAAKRYLGAYGIAPDLRQQDFYQLLDEFF